MARRGRDEHERFERGGKGSTRARTKIRPKHADAVAGFVTGVDRGRYTLLIGEGSADERVVVAMKARELTRDRVVVGDRVDVVGDTSGGRDTLARIVRISERTSVLRRTADDTDPYERIVVANADQLVIVTALAQPEPRTGMIDRAVVAAYDAGMDVLLCLTKADLAPADELRGLYEPLGVKVVVTRPHRGGDRPGDSLALDPASVEEVRGLLLGRVSVFLGHSGVGKSTLVNALVPGARRATGHVNDVTGRGRHTSTSAIALRLPAAPVGEHVEATAADDDADRSAGAGASAGAAGSQAADDDGAGRSAGATGSRAAGDDDAGGSACAVVADGAGGSAGATGSQAAGDDGTGGSADAGGSPDAVGSPDATGSQAAGHEGAVGSADAGGSAGAVSDDGTDRSPDATGSQAAGAVGTDRSPDAAGSQAAGAVGDGYDAAYDGWVVDTPGVRSLGLAHVEVDHLLQAFEDLDEAAADCPRGCTHLDSAPDCALDDWLDAAPDEDARATREARLGSFRRLLASRTASV